MDTVELKNTTPESKISVDWVDLTWLNRELIRWSYMGSA